MNSVVEMFGQAISTDDQADQRASGFASVIPQVLESAPDCGGVLALPFMDDEPGLGVNRGGTAMLVGLNTENATPGNAVKAALLSTMFNMRLGSETLDSQGFPRTELVLSGGLTKTPQLGQVLADVFNTTVSLLDSAEEGTAWGAALMAKYRSLVIDGQSLTWAQFIDRQSCSKTRFEPDAENVSQYEPVYQRYKRLVGVQSSLAEATSF